MARPIGLNEIAIAVPPPKISTIARMPSISMSGTFPGCVAAAGQEPLSEIDPLLGLDQLLLQLVDPLFEVRHRPRRVDGADACLGPDPDDLHHGPGDRNRADDRRDHPAESDGYS